MATRLFVGNLSYSVTEQELREAFRAEKVELRSIRIAMDRDTGRPRGFAFVETETDEGARLAIEKLGGRLVAGRAIIIEEAQARPVAGGPRPGGSRPAPGPGVPPRSAGPSGPRPGVSPPLAPGGSPRGFGPPRSGPGGYEGRGQERGGKSDGRRERPEKKRSTRPKPEERERGNWHWSGILDDD
ncbi:MAG: RNA-binding protein [Deltaproteobacteria bacterium]|nr:RNA-binding protein [Deltaproteobacteria bacterium]